MATPGVDFFRLDRGRPTRRLVGLASVLTGIGGAVVGAHLVHRLDSRAGAFVSLAGGLTLMTGLLSASPPSRSSSSRTSGSRYGRRAVLHDDGRETTVAWEDLDGVTVEPSGHLVLAREGAERRGQAPGASRGRSPTGSPRPAGRRCTGSRCSSAAAIKPNW